MVTLLRAAEVDEGWASRGTDAWVTRGARVATPVAALIFALIFWTAIIVPNFELILSYVKTSPGLRGAD